MPKVTYTSKKGLVQKAGGGFNIGSGPLSLATETLSGAGALNPAVPVTLLTSTGAGQAVTLADGTEAGQVKYVIYNVDGGTSVLTIATPLSVSAAVNTITFTAVGECITLIWTGSAWALVSRTAMADAAAAAVAGYPAISSA